MRHTHVFHVLACGRQYRGTQSIDGLRSARGGAPNIFLEGHVDGATGYRHFGDVSENRNACLNRIQVWPSLLVMCLICFARMLVWACVTFIYIYYT